MWNKKWQVMVVKTKEILNDLRGKTAEELHAELVSAKKELFNLRFQNATNQLDNTARIKDVRKNIARIQTILTQQEPKEQLLKGSREKRKACKEKSCKCHK